MAQRPGRRDALRTRRRDALLALALVWGLGCEPAPRPPDVVLVSVDTLRADAIGAYGARGAATPHIDRLAAEGTLYESAISPMPLTRPTHASMLTGRYPREHGVVNNALSLPDESETLAERLRMAGYRTGAFVSVALLSGEGGFAQGFETFQYPKSPRERPAADAVDAALAWLGTLRGDEPSFLWLHLFDPHLPYAPPSAYRAGADPDLAETLPGLDWDDFERIAAEHGGDVPAPVLRHARQLYRGEVAYTDAWVGRLVAGLRARGRLDDTLLVFTADHGECFGNGVYFEHADCLQQDALRVPLIVRQPGHFEAGARVGSAASPLDVAPTVLHAAGLAPPEAASGRALQGPLPDAERHVLVQHPLYQGRAAEGRARRQRAIRSVAGDPLAPLLVDAQRVGLVGGGWKLLRDAEGETLYRLDGNDERRVDDDTAPGVRERLARELDRALAAHPLHVIDATGINDELRETLEALGYAVSEAETGTGAGPAHAAAASPDAAEIERLRSLGYVDVATDAGAGPRGVVHVDRARIAPGLTYFTNAQDCSSHLVDADGALQRSWRHAPCARWDNSVLLPSGEVLAVHRAPGPAPGEPERRSLLQLGWDGALRSRRDVEAHHDVERTASGALAVLTHRHRRIPKFHPEVDVRDHEVVRFAPYGPLAEEASLVDLLEAAGFAWQPVAPKDRDGGREVDLLHSNSIEFTRPELAPLGPLYAPGHALVSIRHQDAVIVFDFDERELLWSWGPGELIGPHDATFLANGNVLIFDNRIGSDGSRVVEVDPRSDEIVWEYRSSEANPFYTLSRGAAQRLANGNTLVTDSDSGRVFEVTRDGEVVWDFRNPFTDGEGQLLAIVRARRVREAAGPDARFERSD